MNILSQSKPQTESRTDEELVTNVLAGKGEVFSLLYERYYQRVFRLAAGMTGATVAEDLTQEIFFRVFQKLNQFAGQSRFSTWLYRLAVNHCLNARESARPQTQVDTELELLELPSTHTHLEQAVIEKQLQAHVQRALLTLKPEIRMIIILKDIEGLNYDEIAERMGCSPGTVASRLNRGRKLLAEKLAPLRGKI